MKKRDLVLECSGRQCSQGKVEMLENQEAWRQQGDISEGQAACQTCYLTKSQAEQALKVPSSSSSNLFRLANQMGRGNLHVQGDKPVHNETGELCLDDRTKQAAWKEHYECLSNVEFDLNPESLTEVPAPHIPLELVMKAIKLMKCGKTAGTSLIIAEML